MAPQPPRSILLINQAWGNHGDEAAHKSLVRLLRRRFPDAAITVLVFTRRATPLDLRVFRPPEVDRLEYRRIERRGARKRLKRMCRLPRRLAVPGLLASAPYRRAARLMRRCDLVVSAPSGVDLGPYRNWLYLALLLLAVRSGRPTAIYGISIGPLPDRDAHERRFAALAREMLGRVAYLSLRERESQRQAERLGIAHVRTTDTAFLDPTWAPVPEALRSRIRTPYVVVVPNELHAWHHRYGPEHAAVLERLYQTAISSALKSAGRILLMPHLFGGQNDARYLASLRDTRPAADRGSILLVPEELPVEVQKSLVARAEMVVGARSHSIVFALAAGTPFLALAYEHKMHALLAEADLGAYALDIEAPERVPPERVAALFDEVWSRRPEVRREIARKVSPIRATGEAAAEEFCRRFAGGPVR